MHDRVSSNGTPSSTPILITSALCNAMNGVSTSMGAFTPSESARDIVVEELGPCVRERIAGEWTHDDLLKPGPRREHGGLRQQHDVAAFEVDVLVRAVECRRLAADGPVRRGVDVAHVDVEYHQVEHAGAWRQGREKSLGSGALVRLPTPGPNARRPAGRSHSAGLSATQQHGAVETC